MAMITCYKPLPISFSHGEGIWLYDTRGRAYLDATSGIAVCGLGHAHPEVTRTIREQSARLIHASNGYIIEEQERLAKKLLALSSMQQVFFANSGAEANEAAIKLTRLFGHNKGIEQPDIIVMERAFHGRTMATLSASAGDKVRAGFGPYVPGFVRAPFNDLQALINVGNQNPNVVAIMLEPIQGEGGIFVADDAYLRAVEQLCKERNWLFILDEIQTGNGRCGALFASQLAGVKADVITTAKGLGNGVPISACLIQGEACDLFKPGNHGSTFGGNPLACATALTVLQVIERDNLCENAQRLGLRLKDKLIHALKGISGIRDIRGKGLMLGIELDRPASDARMLGLEQGILFNVTAETVIRLLPPLIMNDEEADELVVKLSTTIKQFLGEK